VVFLEESSRRCDADSISLTNLVIAEHQQQSLQYQGIVTAYPAKRLMLLSLPITSESITSPPDPEEGRSGAVSEGGIAGPGPTGSIFIGTWSPLCGRICGGVGWPRRRGNINCDDTTALRTVAEMSRGRILGLWLRFLINHTWSPSRKRLRDE
jgi:hypothetical protein